MTMTRDLPRERWQSFLDDVSASRLNARTVLEVPTDGGVRSEERGLLLRSVSYDPRADEFEVSIVAPSPTGERLLRHAIARPARILIDSLDGVVPGRVTVEDPAGGRTTIRLVADPQVSG